MSKEKQIEEMARIIGHCESTLHPDIECHNKATGCYCIENPCHNQRIADKLYTAGYRKQSEKYLVKENGDIIPLSKQSEWISVEDRLPEEGVDVLVALNFGDRVSVDTDRIYGGKWFGYGELRGVRFVTHWMPFPEAPKMKGGAEE